MDSIEIKNFVDNRENIYQDINNFINSLQKEDEERFEELIDAGNIDEAYSIIEGSGVSLSSFKLILLADNNELRDKLFSEEEYVDILKNCMDMYDDVSMIVNINSRKFNIKDLEALLSLGDSKYSDYYKSVLEKKLSNVNSLSSCIDILKSANTSVLSEEAILSFLEKLSDNIPSDSYAIEFFKFLPNSILQNQTIIKTILDKLDYIGHKEIIEYIPTGENYSQLINLVLDKSKGQFSTLFSHIPPESITKEIWQKACEISPSYVTKIPSVNTNDENYSEWFNTMLSQSISNIKKEEDILIILSDCVNKKIIDEKIWYGLLDKCRQLNFDVQKLTPLMTDTKSLVPQIVDYPMQNMEEEEFYSFLTKTEKEFYKKFRVNNADLYKTLKVEMLDPKIIDTIGIKSLERIVRYDDVQNSILGISKNDDAWKTFRFVFDNLKQDNLFIEPLIEKISDSISNQMTEDENSNIKPSAFLELVSNRINQKDVPFTEYEKNIISYLTLNPDITQSINSYDDILTFVERKNAELESIISNGNSSLIDLKGAVLERLFGMSYDDVRSLVYTYGNDPEQLLESYRDKDVKSLKELKEETALEIITRLKHIMDIDDIDAIKTEFYKLVEQEDISESYIRYQNMGLLADSLRRAYGRDMVDALAKNTGTYQSQEIDYHGDKCVIRKVSGEFDRMVSVLEGYFKSSVTEGDMYDRWNTNQMARTHALCFSLINQSNPATVIGNSAGFDAVQNKKDAIIISVNGFSPESINSAGPTDMGHLNSKNTTQAGEIDKPKFYSAKNMPNQTRNGKYSDYSIEILDVLSSGDDYRKIQPASIICFEEPNEKSIKAAIELSKKLGYTVPIEVIDRRELAKVEMEHIKDSLSRFKEDENMDTSLVEDIVTRFCNVYNAHSHSDLKSEIIESPEAPFNNERLAEILNDCVSSVKQKISAGNVIGGSTALKNIEAIIEKEQEKGYSAASFISDVVENIKADLMKLEKTVTTQTNEAINLENQEKELVLQQMLDERNNQSMELGFEEKVM